MKRLKKIVLVISTAAVLFVSVFAVSSSAADLGDYIQADPQNTLCAVDKYKNLVSGAQYALPSFFIPPENSSGSYLTFGDMQGIKYRWQWYSGDNARFGIHSVSHYTQYLYQSFNYLDIRGIDYGGFDLSIRSNYGTYDGNYGVQSTGGSLMDQVDIILDVVYDTLDLDENGKTVYTAQQLHFTNLRSDKIYMVSDLVKSVIGEHLEYYLRSISVRSGNFINSGDPFIANELLVMLYTDGYRYWEERTNLSDPFTPEIDFIRDVAFYDGYYMGVNDGLDMGFNEGYEEGLLRGYDQGFEEGNLFGYDSGYEIGYSDGYSPGYNDGYNTGYLEGEQNNILVNDGIFSWIINACEGFLSFEIFPNFSFGLVLSLVAGLSILIYILKVVAGG